MRKEFSERVKRKILLWSDRHCCLCGAACGVNIAIHHLSDKDGNDIENAIPLCFNCHGGIHAYDERRAMGNKYRVEELKDRRNQIYDQYTRHLVPLVDYQIWQHLPGARLKYNFPEVGFSLAHLGDFLPVKVRTVLDILINGKPLSPPDSGYYAGNKLWRLNPGHTFFTHFWVPKDVVKTIIEGKKRLTIEVKTTIIDQYEREHELLPAEFVYQRKEGVKEDYWYTEP